MAFKKMARQIPDAKTTFEVNTVLKVMSFPSCSKFQYLKRIV